MELHYATVRRVDVLDEVWATQLAAATNDTGWTPGQVMVPPVLAVIPPYLTVGDLLDAALAPELIAMTVAAAFDARFAGPTPVGTRLATTGAAWSARPHGAGTRLVVRSHAADEGTGESCAELFHTVLLRGVMDLAPFGPDPDDHSLPKGMSPMCEVPIATDGDQSRRYALVVREDGPSIHTDDGMARQAGLPGVILHGTCIMAMAAAAVVAAIPGGEPARLRRLAGRFSAPARPGDTLAATVYDLGGAETPGVYGFTVSLDGATVVSHGRIELGDL